MQDFDVSILTVSAPNTATEKAPNGSINVDVRMCKECKATVFERKDFEAEIARRPPDQRAYEILLGFQTGIRSLLATFQKSLVQLQDPDNPPSHAQLAEAARTRKKLIDSFGKYDLEAKRIRDLPTTSPTQQKLQKALYAEASNFLHIHMLPLKSLPKVLKHASPHGRNTTHPHQQSNLRNGTSALASIKFNESLETSSQVSSSSAVSAIEAEEKELRERLIVLEEQKFFVSEMVADASKRRKWDEVASLSSNVQDLTREIDQVQGMLSQLDFAGAYQQANLGTV